MAENSDYACSTEKQAKLVAEIATNLTY